MSSSFRIFINSNINFYPKALFIGDIKTMIIDYCSIIVYNYIRTGSFYSVKVWSQIDLREAKQSMQKYFTVTNDFRSLFLKIFSLSQKQFQ